MVKDNCKTVETLDQVYKDSLAAVERPRGLGRCVSHARGPEFDSTSGSHPPFSQQKCSGMELHLQAVTSGKPTGEFAPHCTHLSQK